MWPTRCVAQLGYASRAAAAVRSASYIGLSLQTSLWLKYSYNFCCDSSGEVEEANINRSPTSYEANPEEEKAR